MNLYNSPLLIPIKLHNISSQFAHTITETLIQTREIYEISYISGDKINCTPFPTMGKLQRHTSLRRRAWLQRINFPRLCAHFFAFILAGSPQPSD